MEFTDSDQYILLPSFIPKSGSPNTVFSLTVSFWLKLESAATSGFIFRMTRSDLSQNLFAIRMNSMKFILSIGSDELSSNSVIPPSVWHLITAIFTGYTHTNDCSYLLYMNGTQIGRLALELPQIGTLAFLPSDLVFLGGPGGFTGGKIANLKIFNPGSNLFIPRK